MTRWIFWGSLKSTLATTIRFGLCSYHVEIYRARGVEGGQSVTNQCTFRRNARQDRKQWSGLVEDTSSDHHIHGATGHSKYTHGGALTCVLPGDPSRAAPNVYRLVGTRNRVYSMFLRGDPCLRIKTFPSPNAQRIPSTLQHQGFTHLSQIGAPSGQSTILDRSNVVDQCPDGK